MGKSSSNDELTIRNQFDRICKLALKGEAADYYRHIAYRQKHEVLFSELSQKELDSIFGVDKYTVGYTSALKAPVRCFGNHLSGKRKSWFRTDNDCGGAAILKTRTSRMGTPVGC